jgi:hypothetical protein
VRAARPDARALPRMCRGMSAMRAILPAFDGRIELVEAGAPWFIETQAV